MDTMAIVRQLSNGDSWLAKSDRLCLPLGTNKTGNGENLLKQLTEYGKVLQRNQEL